MKKILSIVLAITFLATMAGLAAAGDNNPLKDGEKAFHKELTSLVPKDKVKTIDDLYTKWEEVLAGKSDAILLDVRTHPEFDAFHIEGTSHIHAGHMYTIPGKIKDPNKEIWVFCRTQHRSGYVAGMLYKYGYKNVYWVGKAADGTEGGIVGWIKRGHPIYNYFFGFATKDGVKYIKQGAYTERNCKNYIREFSGQRGEKCGK